MRGFIRIHRDTWIGVDSLFYVALIAVAAITLRPAAAQDLPRYDPAASCEQMAGLGGTRSAIVYKSCLEAEQLHYDKLKPAWAGLSPSTKASCQQMATLGGGPGSYIILGTCVEAETAAARSTPAFKY